MTILIGADLHLDAAASLGRLPDQESSWKRFCTAAAELGATVLWAGDSHHFRKPSPAAIAAWQSGLRILREGDCEMLAVPGNHCITSEDLPSTVEVASAGFNCHVARGPEVVETPDGVVGLLPWAPPRLSAAETSERLMVVCADLAEQGARILIAHHAIAGGSLPTGLPVLDLAEPLLDPFALEAMGYQAVIAGHIHKRLTIVDSGDCLIAQCGPLVRGNWAEADCETGGWQIQNARGRPVCCGHITPHGDCCMNPIPEDTDRLEAWPFDVEDRRFVTVEADVRAWPDETAALLDEINMARGIAGAIVRVRWQQRSDQVVDTAALLAMLAERGAHRVAGLLPEIERVQSIRSAGVSELTDPRESFDLWWEQQGETASREVLARVREVAHERIASAS